MKDVDRKDVVEVEALDEEPMKHRRAAVLQQHVEALAEVRLKLEKYISLGLNTDIGQGRRGTRSLQPPACSVFDKYVNSRYRRFT